MVKRELFEKVISLIEDKGLTLTNAVKSVTGKGLPRFKKFLDDAQKEKLKIARQNRDKGKNPNGDKLANPSS